MAHPAHRDEFERVLRQLEAVVDDSVRLQQALDDARRNELTRRHFPERRRGDRRQSVERRAVDRRQRPQ